MAPPVSGSSQGNAAPPQVSQDAAARSRMHECGHQWSSMKKAGTVGVLTWKEFSAGCLALNK